MRGHPVPCAGFGWLVLLAGAELWLPLLIATGFRPVVVSLGLLAFLLLIARNG